MGKKNQGKRKIQTKEEDDNEDINDFEQSYSESPERASYNDSDEDQVNQIDYAPRKDKKISKSRGKVKNGKEEKKFSKKQEIEDSLENQKHHSVKKSKRAKEMSDVKSEESQDSEEEIEHEQEAESSSISNDQDDEDEENDKISSISSQASSQQNQVKKQDNPVKSEREHASRRLQLNYQMVQNGIENITRPNLNYDALLQLPELINRLILETVEIKKSLNEVKSAVVQNSFISQTSSPPIETMAPVIKREKIEVISEQKKSQSQKQMTWKTDTKSSEPEKSEKKAKKVRRADREEGSRIVIE